jgi:hypothetical protein
VSTQDPDNWNLPIPTGLSPEELRETLRGVKEWFYPFRFQNGVETGCVSKEAALIHETRARMIFEALEGKIAGRGVLDLGCHQGWWSQQILLRGADRVWGYDCVKSRVDDARMVSSAYPPPSNDVWDSPDFFHNWVSRLQHVDPHDIVLCLGLLYHSVDPFGLLQSVRKLTQGLAIIETQVIPKPCPRFLIKWGSAKPRYGLAMALVDADPENSTGHFSMVPSLQALMRMIRRAGFGDTTLLQAPKGSHPQFMNEDRVIVVCRP